MEGNPARRGRRTETLVRLILLIGPLSDRPSSVILANGWG